jgi:Co/Zn/Cd efflux system component
MMSDCGCQIEATHAAQRRMLWLALGLNAAMAIIETLAGLKADSTGLLADALDMLTDAGAYAIALAAIGRSQVVLWFSCWASGYSPRSDDGQRMAASRRACG